MEELLIHLVKKNHGKITESSAPRNQSQSSHYDTFKLINLFRHQNHKKRFSDFFFLLLRYFYFFLCGREGPPPHPTPQKISFHYGLNPAGIGMASCFIQPERHPHTPLVIPISTPFLVLTIFFFLLSHSHQLNVVFFRFKEKWPTALPYFWNLKKNKLNLLQGCHLIKLTHGQHCHIFGFFF